MKEAFIGFVIGLSVLGVLCMIVALAVAVQAFGVYDGVQTVWALVAY